MFLGSKWKSLIKWKLVLCGLVMLMQENLVKTFKMLCSVLFCEKEINQEWLETKECEKGKLVLYL